MKLRFLIVFLACSISLFGSCSKWRTTETPANSSPGEKSLASGESANWKFAVVSAKCDPTIRLPDAVGLVLKFRVEYIGPSGSVAAPSLVVRNIKWQKIPAGQLTLEKREGETLANPETLAWLTLTAGEMPNEPRTMQTGEKYQFGVVYDPTRAPFVSTECHETGLTVLFGDVAPISF